MSAQRFWNLVALGLAGALTACATGAYEDPYALVEPGLRSAVRKEAPAFIHAVDGQIPVSSRYSIPLTPGKHVLDVYFSTDSSAGAPEKHRRVVDLQAAPCTRYRVVARYTNFTHPDWEPVVYSEPIAECLERFRR